MKEKEKELGELEKKLSVKQRMDMVLKANDGIVSLTNKDLSARKWSWNTSVKMVNARLQEERLKEKKEVLPLVKHFRARSLAKIQYYPGSICSCSKRFDELKRP